MNHDDFIKLISEYLLNGSQMSEGLKQEFEEHFMTCNDCWEAFEAQKIMIGVLEDETDQLFSEVEVEELLENANGLIKENKPEEAIKCFKEALEQKPGDEDIEQKLIKVIQQNSGAPGKNIVVRVNGSVVPFTVDENKCTFYLYQEGLDIEDKEISFFIDVKEYMGYSLLITDIVAHKKAAATVISLEDKKERQKTKKQPIIMHFEDFRRSPFRRVPFDVSIDPDGNWAKVYVNIPIS